VKVNPEPVDPEDQEQPDPRWVLNQHDLDLLREKCRQQMADERCIMATDSEDYLAYPCGVAGCKLHEEENK